MMLEFEGLFDCYSKNDTNLYPILESPSEIENNKSENSKNNLYPTTFLQNEEFDNHKKKNRI